MDFMNVKEAALYGGFGVQNVYKAMRNGTLRSKKIPIVPLIKFNPSRPTRSYQLVTTKEWVDEWNYKKYKKEHIKFNGKPMFDKKKGEMTSGQARAYLGLTKNQFFHYLYTGRLKFTRKGTFYIFYTEDLDKLRDVIEVKENIA
jgi:hypothetical protein